MTLEEFRNVYCTGREYDSCANSPCLYSNHSEGCTHPMHPKNIKDYSLLYCPICRSNITDSRYRLYTRDTLRSHLAQFHRRADVANLMILANDFVARHQWIMNGNKRQEAQPCGK